MKYKSNSVLSMDDVIGIVACPLRILDEGIDRNLFIIFFESYGISDLLKWRSHFGYYFEWLKRSGMHGHVLAYSLWFGWSRLLLELYVEVKYFDTM